LAILLAIGIGGELPTLGNTVAHLFFLHNLNYSWTGAINAAWWTLPIEMQFYFIFPIIILFALRFGWCRVLLLAFIAVIAWRYGAYRLIVVNEVSPTIDYKLWLIEQLPGRVDQFLVGMFSARLAATQKVRILAERYRSLSTVLLLLGVLGTLILVYLLWPRAQLYWQGHWLLFVWHSFIAIPLAMAIFGSSLGGALTKATLGSNPIVWLGEISYSFYLWNYIILVGISRIEMSGMPITGLERFVFVGGLGLIATLTISTFSWWFIERPFLLSVGNENIRKSVFQPRLSALLATRVLLASGLIILVVIGAGQWYRWPNNTVQTICNERGAIDSSKEISSLAGIAHIVGWAHDWRPGDPIRRIIATIKGNEIATASLTTDRPDVVNELMICQITGKPGFELSIPLSLLPSADSTISVTAERASGTRFAIGDVNWRFGPPYAILDRTDPPGMSDMYELHGWAWHPSGAVNVQWVREGTILASTVSGLSRQDVANSFPNWTGAANSGFQIRVNVHDLPRGSGDTILRFISPDGKVSEIKGPLYQNNSPIGIVSSGSNNIFDASKNIPISAWVFDEQPIAKATVVTELGQQLTSLYPAQHNIELADFLRSRPTVSQKPYQHTSVPMLRGTVLRGLVSAKDIPKDIQRLLVEVSNREGRKSFFPGPLVVNEDGQNIKACKGRHFTVYFWANTAMLREGLTDILAIRRLVQRGCVQIGVHVRVEYLRTTKGRSADFVFDPDFPEPLRTPLGVELTTTNLNEVLRVAKRLQIPMRILLDGGVWADSVIDYPEYDVTDFLEQDERNVQWNQFDKSEPDDALKGQPGGHSNPQIARVMSLNYYNHAYRYYKMRNLQDAIRRIVEYNSTATNNKISISLDPDTYINPWFYLKQWYDYNPKTLRQFRDWLLHLGPYGVNGELKGLGYHAKLSLVEINRLANAQWTNVNDISPPRSQAEYNDPWHQMWTQFKRHLVAMHYSDLARWAADAGLDRKLIFSAQTFIQADVSVSGRDQATGWVDEAGVSIAGAKTRDGHLGAILYGPASRNQGVPRTGRSLFGNIRERDPFWEVVEMNPADISQPNRIPDHSESYRTLMEIYNYGAGAISPMWTGMAGDRTVLSKEFKSYETYFQSPFETQLVLFLRTIHDFPAGSQVWPFGNAYTASSDGFVPLFNSVISELPGAIKVTSDSQQGVSIKRNLDNLVLPFPACITIQTKGFAPSGDISIEESNNKVVSRTWKPSKSGAITIEMPSISDTPLEGLVLSFNSNPVTIDKVAVSSCVK
jgi:peptidoglycan/LPS O-acetylase OafA/YrhL